MIFCIYSVYAACSGDIIERTYLLLATAKCFLHFSISVHLKCFLFSLFIYIFLILIYCIDPVRENVLVILN